MKKTLFVFLLLFPTLAHAYTETFYVCDGGDGTLPESPVCATAYDEADFNTAGNWDTDDADDGKIGPNDVVYFMDAGGPFDIELVVQTDGLSAKPITFMPYSGDTPVFSPSAGSAFQIDKQYITLDCAGENGDQTMTLNAGSASPIIQGYAGGDTTDNLTVNGCTLVGGGPSGCFSTFNTGIHIRSDNFTITNNEVSHMTAGIIFETDAGGDTGVHNGTISGNYVHDMDCDNASSADGILVKNLADAEASADFSGITIEKNRIVNYRDDGIDTIYSAGVTIQYNEIYRTNATDTGGDCNAIKVGGARSWSKDHVVRYNYIHDIDFATCSGENYGIETNGAAGMDIYGNVVVGVGMVGGVGGRALNLNANGHTGSGEIYRVYNNILYGEDRGISAVSVATTGTHVIQNNIASGASYDIKLNSMTDDTTGGYNILVNDACVYDQGTDTTAPCTYVNYTDTNSSDLGATDPLLTSEYRLTSTSPAIGSGVTLATTYKVLDPSSQWVDSVTAVENASPSEIGAFIYLDPPQNYYTKVGNRQFVGSLDASSADEVRVKVATSCAGQTKLGAICFDSDDLVQTIGTGSGTQKVGGVLVESDITDLTHINVDALPFENDVNDAIASGWAYDHENDVSTVVHYTQGNITEVGTVASGDVSAIEADPVVGEVIGIIKADGGGNISAAVADTDYQSVLAEGAFVDGDKTKLDSWIDVIATCNASGQGDVTTTGSITTGTNELTVADATGWENGMGIAVDDAGSEGDGDDLVCEKVTVSGTTLTLFQSDGTTPCNATATATNDTVFHDDTYAIENCIANNYLVQIPVGQYNITSAIDIALDNRIIRGSGHSGNGTYVSGVGTRLNNRPADNNVIVVADGATQLEGIEISNLDIFQDTATIHTAGAGILIGGSTTADYTTRSLFSDINIWYTYVGMQVNSMLNCVVENSFFGGAAFGLYVHTIGPWGGNQYNNLYAHAYNGTPWTRGPTTDGTAVFIDGSDADQFTNANIGFANIGLKVDAAAPGGSYYIAGLTFTNLVVEGIKTNASGSEGYGIWIVDSNTPSDAAEGLQILGGHVNMSTNGGYHPLYFDTDADKVAVHSFYVKAAGSADPEVELNGAEDIILNGLWVEGEIKYNDVNGLTLSNSITTGDLTATGTNTNIKINPSNIIAGSATSGVEYLPVVTEDTFVVGSATSTFEEATELTFSSTVDSLTITEDSAYPYFMSNTAGAANVFPLIIGQKAGNTIASPTSLASGNSIFRIDARGYNAAANGGLGAYQIGATIKFEADAGWGGSTTDAPTRIEFATVPDASDTLNDRLVIYSDGKFFLDAADSNPGTGPGDGGYLYVDNADSDKLKWIASDNTVYEMATPATVSISDAAYNITTWNTDTDGASKNALRDYFAIFDTDGDGDLTDETYWTSTGDAVSIDGSAVTDPDFVSTGDIDFVDTANTVTANINADAVGNDELDLIDGNSATDEYCLTYEGGGANGTLEWQECAAAGGDITAVGPGCSTGACFTDGVTTTGTNLLIWEGTTADANDFSIVVPEDPGSAIAITMPTTTGTLMLDTGSTNLVTTGTVTTGTWGADLAADTVDALTEIDASIKTGLDDSKLVTGTAGATDTLAKWDANDDLVAYTLPGANTNVIFNSSGAFGADAGFTYASDVLSVIAENNYPVYQLQSFDSGTTYSPLFIGLHASGTAASPAATASGQKTFILQGRGYDNAGTPAVAIGAQMNFLATGNWTTSGHPTEISFETTHTGETSTTERFVIESDGKVDMNYYAGTGTRQICVDSGGVITACPGKVHNTKSAGYVIGTDDARECYGGTIYVTSNVTITMCDNLDDEMSFTVIVIGGNTVNLSPQADNRIYKDGTLAALDEDIVSTGNTGAIATCHYYNGTTWYCGTGDPQGTLWTEATP